MTFRDPSLESPPDRPGAYHENTQGVIPPTERSQDPLRSETASGLMDSSRPLTEEERKAADRSSTAGERVYAPASERVPVQPVPGHREMVEHPDTHTPEREAAGESDEPSFTRVPRPSATNGTPVPGAYASPMSNPGFSYESPGSSFFDRRQKLFFGLGAGWFTVICSGVGAWMSIRWQRERNKPINRMRRQARQAVQRAQELRERVPVPTSPEEAARPAMGLTTALLSIGLLLWQQNQRRSRNAEEMIRGATDRASSRAEKTARKAASAVSDVDWQHRLMDLRKRWNPGRIEREKLSISRR